MKPLIVGGGPVGGYLASHFPSATLIDQKSTRGSPVRCTGILTDDISTFLRPQELKKSTLNTIKTATIHGPTQTASVPIGTNHIICNSTFERQFIEKAEKNGTRILFKHKYLSSTGAQHHVRDMENGKRKIIKSDQLVGCDGPQSTINKAFSIQKKKKQYMGFQIRLKVSEHENAIQFYPHIGQYAWYVPESENIARVGVCTSGQPKPIFNAFLKKFKGTQLNIQAGFIPYHQPFQKTTFKASNLQVSLLGDAAGHIKNTTGGGIVPGIKAAQQFIDTDSNYKGMKGSLQRELYSHFLVHNILKQCTPKEWDAIIKAVEHHKEDFGNISRDQLWKLAPKLLKNRTFIGLGLKKAFKNRIFF
ncbi:MAG: NAD(P)/FAD-dependent oxidoreductase [Nanoarchaeota archaeon]|nr:NAD(P)/FAD-dependent oxidoreductase [Nanoarchaeota archaeon]